MTRCCEIQALPFSEIRATFAVLKNLTNLHRVVPITAEQFHYAFTNTLTEAEFRVAYERCAVPVPARSLFQGGLANFTHNAATTYNFVNDDRGPLRFIAGGRNHICRPRCSTRTTRKYQTLGRDHRLQAIPRQRPLHLRAPGWEEVADFALNWALNPAPGELN